MINLAIMLGILGLIFWAMNSVLSFNMEEGSILSNILSSSQYFFWLIIPIALVQKLSNRFYLIAGAGLGFLAILIYAAIHIFEINKIKFFKKKNKSIKSDVMRDMFKKERGIFESIAGIIKGLWLVSLMIYFIEVQNILVVSIIAVIIIFTMLMYISGLIELIKEKPNIISTIVPKNHRAVKIEIFVTFLLGILCLKF